MPLLLKSASPRLLFITSGTSPLVDTERIDAQYALTNASPAAGWPKSLDLSLTDAHRSTKTGLNMMMGQWHRILKNDDVKVFAVSSGFLATGLWGIGEETPKQVSSDTHITLCLTNKDITRCSRPFHWRELRQRRCSREARCG